MEKTTTAPRVEIVGSFLPPEELENAIADRRRGAISDEEFHAVEDAVIDRLIDREIEAGLKIVTDGEMRRKWWDRDFWEGLEGIDRERIESGSVWQDEPVRRDLLRFNGRVRFNPGHPFFEKFTHLKKLVAGRAEVRQTMPSPGELYMRIISISDGKPERIYPSPDTLIEDIIEAYRLTIDELYRLGCRHIQFDSTVWGRLTDTYFQRTLLLAGLDPEVITGRLIEFINKTVAGRPADLEITLAITDEARLPNWDSEAEQAHLHRMFEEADADAFLLPFDLMSPGQLEQLRKAPAGKRVTIGLVNSATSGLENVADIVNAIRVARGYVDVDRLSISPICGFKVSDRELQGLNYETQWSKIDLLNRAAQIAAEEE